MRNVTKLFLLFGIITLVTFSCEEEEELETDPTKVILGKWELTETGNGSDLEPVKNPLVYTEFLPDSIFKQHIYSTGNVVIRKYWMVDSILYLTTMYEDEFAFYTMYKYQFYNNNSKMRLDIQAFATANTAIYKRIN